jgi:hypothetical protein
LNLILGNLRKLKSYLLPESWQEQSAKDLIIESLGLGVAESFEAFCDRKFARAVGTTEEFSGERESFVLERYPLEAKPTLHMRQGGSATWETYTDAIAQWSSATGIVTLNGTAGDEWSVFRVTSTGGYWIDEAENLDSGETTIPVGAFALPRALERAWLDQCRHVWSAGKLFANVGENDPKLNALVEIDLLPTVQKTLNQYRRMTL